MTDGRAGGSRVRTVFLGSGGFGIDALRRLAERSDIELVGVVTAPPRGVGRRQVITPTGIDTVARELGVPAILTPVRLRAPEAVASVLDLDPELAVLADYGQLVPLVLLGLRHGALNLHPSLLPRHRGATPIPAAILAGDAETGVTLMRMDEGIDTGPIVAQTRTPIDDMETAAELEARLAIEAADLLERSLGPWLRRELEARSQSVDGATVTRPFRREDGRLDISRPTIEVARQLRAHQPWPGSFVDTAVGRLIIWKWAWGSDGPAHGVFGPAGLGVHGSQLLLEDVQPAGGRRMAWDAFVRGRPGILGSAALASEP